MYITSAWLIWSCTRPRARPRPPASPPPHPSPPRPPSPSSPPPTTIVTNIWIGFPFNFILLYAGMRGIPEDVYEAAKIDEASFWERVAYITMPLLKPVSVAVLMLGTIYTVKVFDVVWIMTRGGPANGTHLLSTYA